MTFRERLRNPFVQQYLLEILLPLIGYFFFDWSLVIIAAFYVIDQVASEISFLRKFAAIRKFENKTAVVFLTISSLVFAALLCLELVVLLDYFAPHGLARLQHVLDELKAFAKDELWLLFPLVLLMYYLKDQFTFFIPRRFSGKNSSRFFIWHWIANFSILALIVLAIELAKNSDLHDVAAIGIFLALKLIFDFTVAKIADHKSNK
ncbi:MAG: hypothetical protein HYZ14_04950 [Bacteroidetes bacterium]|nr:hypothetical protein [Bacteroidota bacterium]